VLFSADHQRIALVSRFSLLKIYICCCSGSFAQNTFPFLSLSLSLYVLMMMGKSRTTSNNLSSKKCFPCRSQWWNDGYIFFFFFFLLLWLVGVCSMTRTSSTDSSSSSFSSVTSPSMDIGGFPFLLFTFRIRNTTRILLFFFSFFCFFLTRCVLGIRNGYLKKATFARPSPLKKRKKKFLIGLSYTKIDDFFIFFSRLSLSFYPYFLQERGSSSSYRVHPSILLALSFVTPLSKNNNLL